MFSHKADPVWLQALISKASERSIDRASSPLSKCSGSNKSITLFMLQSLSHWWLPTHLKKLFFHKPEKGKDLGVNQIRGVGAPYLC